MNAYALSRPGRMIAALALPLLALALLAGLLALSLAPASAHSQPLTASPAAAPAAEQAEEPAGAADPAPLEDCPADAPAPPGQEVVLADEDEINLTWRYSDGDRSLQTAMLNLNSTGTSLDMTHSTSTGGGLSSVGLTAAVVTDLNATSSGDRKHELVTALKDSSSRIGVVSSAVPGTEWYMSGGAYDGGNVAYVDIAAGDLGRGGTYPLDDEVVVAFRDDNYDLHLITLNGKGSTGGISNAANTFMSEYVDSTEGRGNVWFVAVETGDFNGDGYDDEIVTVFKDSDSDLQAVVLRHDGTTTLTKLWSKKWQNHGRGDVAADNSLWNNARNPIDVTTGDIDGDHRDEIIAGFRVGSGDDGDLQLLVLDPSVDTKGTATLTDDVYSFDDRVWWNHKLDDYYAMAALSVSLSAADFDGDGVDEMAVGYGSLNATGDHDTRAWKRYLVSYEYVPITSSQYTDCTNSDGRAIACSCVGDDLKPVACLQQRPGRWASSRQNVPLTSNEAGNGAVVSVDTGDIDADGYAEIALAWLEPDTSDVLTEVFDADSGLSSSPRFSYRYDSGSNRMEDFWLAVGDRDGDAKWGVYKSCHVKDGAQVMAVVHAPPHWSDEEMYPNTWETEAGFGVSVGMAKGGGETNTSTIGGHVETEVDIGAAFSKYGERWKGIGPVFSRGWETSWSTGHEAMTSTFSSGSFTSFTPHDANDSGGEPDFDQLGVVETHDWCYVYYEPSLGDIDVCLPYPSGDMSWTPYNLEVWWTDLAEAYPDTWVPVGRNLAKGLTGAVSQNSNYTSLTTADKAVDGNRSGDWNAESMAATGGTSGVYSYWQLDLGNGIADPAGAHSTLGRQWINGILLWNRTDCCSDRLKGAYIFVSEKPFTSTNPNVLKADPNVWTHQLSTTDVPEQRTIVPVNGYGRYVRVQLPQAGLCLYLGEVEVYGVPATPKDWPAIGPATDTPDEGQYQLTWRDGHTQNVTGDFLWSDALAPGMGARKNGGVPSIATGGETEHYIIQAGETASEKSIGLKVKGKTIAFDWGSSETKEYRTGWTAKVEFSAALNGLGAMPDELKPEFEYDAHSYVWVQRDVSRDGMEQAFPVLDYWVPADVAPDPPNSPPALTGPFLTPMLPQLDSPTHPDEATWYAANTATFTWAQPPGDPAAITGYRLKLDQAPGTIPPHYSPEPGNTHTFEGLADGVWTMHVVAASGDEWSETAHRKIQVDATPPAITLKLDPPLPTGNNSWYNTPVDAVVTATDGNGSGVATIETSTDGVTWQPYPAPRTFNADTPGTKVYARATDGAGHVSAVLTASFKIDRTPPDSHALFAGIITGPLGNQQLVLEGDIEDALSGRAGMHVGIDRLGTGDPAGLDWTSASDIPNAPGIQATWRFTATRELGAGNHRFFGQAQDAAGNVEAPYEIATVLWPPAASPDIAGSSVSVSPAVVRPDEDLTFSLTARNGGFQDAYVGITTVLPEGLVPLTETLPSGVTYDEASRTLAWPPELLWPGEWMRSTFQAHADAGLAAGTLPSPFTFHAGWLNTESLPPADRQVFLDHEQTFAATANVRIDPTLPADADATPPWAGLVRAASEQPLGGSVAPLAIHTSEDAAGMYVREWTLDPTTGQWNVARSSGWIAFSPTLDWTLSAGHGVKYIGVWVRDAAGNVSALDEDALTFVNRWDGNATLAAGQRVHYRGNLQRGQPMFAELTTLAGDPDLFGWWPDNGFAPNLYSNVDVGPGQTEAIGENSLHESGRYLVEVASLGDSDYKLDFPWQRPEAMAATAAARVASGKPLPEHPLAVSDPLSAAQLGPRVAGPATIYLPALLKP